MTELSFLCSAPTRNIPRVLSIAGSDPSGGAGIQADLKSIAANGGYGMAAITALTAQNTLGVRAVHIPPVEFLLAQLDAVADDVQLDAVKIGMLGDAVVIAAVHRWLLERKPPIVVLDPVMVSSSGARLLTSDGENALRDLVAVADVVTPNIDELAVLVGVPAAQSWEEAVEQGKALAHRTQSLVLVKGGHLEGEVCADALVDPSGTVREFESSRVSTRNTHGTGCSTSAALATIVARVGDWGIAMERVKSWLHGALESADELEVGGGHGPVNHFHHLWQQMPPSGDAFSSSVWAQTSSLREEICELFFVKALGDGTLPEQLFTYYLAQDALYLNAYSRVLARASALAPSEEEQRFWANSAHNALVVETQLHKEWLQGESGALGPVTKAYVDHLLAVSAQGSYGTLVAAVLPCFWLYANVGEVLLAQYQEDQSTGAQITEPQPNEPQEHPYRRWLETYSDPDFAEATRQAVNIMDSAAAAGSAQERLQMRQAFADSARYERDFFAAPLTYAPACRTLNGATFPVK